jgi:FMN phosphatase YigB (HAD superfamily)
MRTLGQDLGIEVTGEDAQRLARSVPDWPAFGDSHDALTALSKSYKLIILSNVDRASFAGSNRRLAVTFDGILTAEDIGSYKPSNRNFEALLAEAARLGVGEGKLLHVAHSLFHDHVPAKRSGLRSGSIVATTARVGERPRSRPRWRLTGSSPPWLPWLQPSEPSRRPPDDQGRSRQASAGAQPALSLDRLRSIAAAIGAVASVECPTGCRAR